MEKMASETFNELIALLSDYNGAFDAEIDRLTINGVNFERDDDKENLFYLATFRERWAGSIHDAEGNEIENSGEQFFASGLSVFKWAKSKGVTRRMKE